MKRTVELYDSMSVEYVRDKGHTYVSLRIVRENGNADDLVNFIYDTGAVITVLSRNTYERFKLDKLSRIHAVLPGYAGDAPGWVYQIPGICLGCRTVTGVYAFSPEDRKLGQNLLADNVIEYFRIFQDTENRKMYFLANPQPKPLTYEVKGKDGKPAGEVFSLACTDIYLTDSPSLSREEN